MNINWSTVFFQIVNFLIIVWILKKYLFKPVLSAMEKREKIIQDRLKDAESAKKLADRERQNLKVKVFELEKSKNDILAEAYKNMEAEQEKIMADFNIDMQNKRKLFQKNIEEEREQLRLSIKDLAGETMLNSISFALKDLANYDVQVAIFNNFIAKIIKAEIEKVDELKKFYQKSKKIVLVSSFVIDDNQKNIFIEAMEKLLGEKPKSIEFKQDANLLCGMEVISDSLLISFGLDNYINQLKVSLDKALASLTKTSEIIDEKKS